MTISRLSELLNTGISDPSRSNFVALLTERDETVACIHRTQGLLLSKARTPKIISN